jgi:hypothetical protein
MRQVGMRMGTREDNPQFWEAYASEAIENWEELGRGVDLVLIPSTP